MTRAASFFTTALMATAVSGFSPSSLNTNGNSLKNKGVTSLNAMTLDGQDIRGEITPLGNFVLVRTKDTLAATGGGILLPDQVRSIHNLSKGNYSHDDYLQECSYIWPDRSQNTRGTKSKI